MKKKTVISSKVQITRTLMVFVIPLMLFLCSYNLYTVNVLNDKLAETGLNIIKVYQNPIEKELHIYENLMVDMIANDPDFQQMLYVKEYVDVYLYSKNVLDKLKRSFSTSTATVGAIVYHGGMSVIREIYTSNYSYDDKDAFKILLKSSVNNEIDISKKDWALQQINGKPFLFRILHKKDAYIMLIFDLDKTDKPQNYPDNKKDAFLFFADAQMNPLTSCDIIEEEGFALEDSGSKAYYTTGKQQKYLIVQRKMENSDLYLLYAVPYYSFISSDNKVPLFFLMASILIVCLLLLSFKMLREKYLKPLQKLIDTMEIIKSGDIEAKVTYENNISEFNLLFSTFNEMLEEIKLLKISAYEYQLEMGQAKLQYLQIQIRPHFFLNCLKNLYSLAEEGKCGQIQEMILALSSHLRYMFQNSFQLVPLEMELQNVKNYILLQQMTASYQITCHIDIDPKLIHYEIPPLSILTFTENSIKHANMVNRHLRIHIKAWILEGDAERFINITILDNGKGFSKEALEELNGNTDFGYHSKHVGIQNVKHRFSLIYKNECTFSFSNITGSGASIQIYIPILEENDSERGM